MKVYFDTCIYGRPNDDRTDPDIMADIKAIYGIIEVCKAAGIAIVGSHAVPFEIGRTPDNDLRDDIMTFYRDTVDEQITLPADAKTRAISLQTSGIGKIDSFHLAAAEQADVDFLLTTDKKFLSRTTNKHLSIVHVVEPIIFLPEVTKWLQ